MYEKYTGLPDTTKSPQQPIGRIPIPPQQEEGGGMYRDFSEPNTMPRANNHNHYSGGYGGGSTPQKRLSKKKRLRRRRMLVGGTTLALLILLIVAIVVIVKSCKEPVDVPIDPATDTFRSGVYVNGAALAGLTLDEARPTLESNEAYAISNIAITLSGEGFNAVVSGADMGAKSNLDEVLTTALSGDANQVYYTTISIDEGMLATRIDQINETLSAPPTDATFTVEFSSTGKLTFNYIEGTAGRGLDVHATAELVSEALKNQQKQSTITPALTTIQPAVTVADLQANTQLIGSYSTTYDFKGTAEDTLEQREVLIPNRAFNVEKSAGLINNQVIKPGRTWSFNNVVGDRTEKRGWKEANGIFGGDRYNLQYGGGVCQVSTTLYNALLACYPNIEIVSRRAHSIPSTYVEKGLDATVDSDHIDFKFKNTSEYPMYIFSYCVPNKRSSSRKRDIHVLIYGKALPEGVTYKPHTELIEETLPGEPVIVDDKTQYVGVESIIAEARSRYVLDVFIDRYLNGTKQESIFMYTDTYEGNPLKKKVGIMPTPSPSPTATPVPIPMPNPMDMP